MLENSLKHRSTVSTYNSILMAMSSLLPAFIESKIFQALNLALLVGYSYGLMVLCFQADVLQQIVSISRA